MPQIFFQQVDFSKFFSKQIKTCETLEVGAQAAAYVLSSNNDVKTDSEVLSHLTATLLSSDMKGTELGSYNNKDNRHYSRQRFLQDEFVPV